MDAIDDLVLVDQDELAKSIETKAEAALERRLRETEQKRLDKARAALAKARLKLLSLERQLPRAKISARRLLATKIDDARKELEAREQDIRDIERRIDGDDEGETEHDYLVRTGKITAFGTSQGFVGGETTETKSHQQLHEPGINQTVDKRVESQEEVKEENEEEIPIKQEDDGIVEVSDDSGSAYESGNDASEPEDEEEYAVVVNDELDELREPLETPEPLTERNIDDGDMERYRIRLDHWETTRRALRVNPTTSPEDEPYLPHPTIEDAVLDNTFRLPGDIHPLLFDYQKTCVQWLWELYNQKTGGILGDEMGLGKTVQVISFLAGLHHLKIIQKPILVVVPATVLAQWCNEFHRWWPPFRVVLLHAIGLGITKKKLLEEDELEAFVNGELLEKETTNAGDLVKLVFNDQGGSGVIITTYLGLRIYRRHLLGRQWGYAVLDEGHKIRNPNLMVLLSAKQIRTHNRLILLGTPIQNNLTELWLLFDFVYPGRLGTLPVFQQQFAVPINMGGYANATNVQVQAGYKCAVVLREMINPYLLRRVKADVARDLPQKKEMVVFVKLTPQQRQLYSQFLGSEDLLSIMRGKRNVLYGVDILRKVCNHPDLVHQDQKRPKDYGAVSRSGKMTLLALLLPQWQRQGHKTLLFCQTRQMLDILETQVQGLTRNDGLHFGYLRMDGNTPIGVRQQLVDEFNTSSELDVFLLTTKVGGLGVNLTGADRVIIFDPDWNPLTDVQARERAWRLGQTRDIVIYRLMTAGTIEEKIYHRQIFKTFLTNKILTDPKQKRLFKMNDLHDLFTLGDDDEKGTETADMFKLRENQYAGTKLRSLKRLDRDQDVDDDVLEVAGVAKMDNYEDGTAQDPENSEFFNLGVHLTLQHDDAVRPHEETLLAEHEANKVAQQAVAALKKLAREARQNKVGTPTWTGKFGALKGQFGKAKSTAPGKRLASPELQLLALVLASLKRHKSSDADGDDVVENPVLAKMVAYLRSQPNQFAPLKAVLDAAEVPLTLKQEMLNVRSMLRAVAHWDAAEKGWHLKAQFVE